MEYNKTVETVNTLLTNEEWILRYKNYSTKIIANQQKYIEGRRKFHVRPPLFLYTSINNLLRKNSLKYDLRFLGQSVATIQVKNNDVIITTGNKAKSNEKYFNVNINTTSEWICWNSSNANKFRKSLKDCISSKTKSNEHRVESSLLSEFRKSAREKKSLCNIQPVLLANTFFQMKTPINASRTERISYSKQNGGGIDILSRVKHLDNSVRLCVMELKDEYSSSEPPKNVIKQAIAYATFLARLLRSVSGNTWYKIFGFSGDVPRKLIIDAATVMPLPQGKEKIDFDMERLKVCENTYIELHALYFLDNKENSINKNHYEFIGSLKDNMLP